MSALRPGGGLSQLCRHPQVVVFIKTRDLDSLNISLSRRNEQCLPFTIEYREGKGNVIVAARDIKPFETILIDRPAIVGPFDDTLPECLECFSEVSVEGYKVIYRKLPMVLCCL